MYPDVLNHHMKYHQSAVPKPRFTWSVFLHKALPNIGTLSPPSPTQVAESHCLYKDKLIQFLVHPNEFLDNFLQHHILVLSTATMTAAAKNNFVCKEYGDSFPRLHKRMLWQALALGK